MKKSTMETTVGIFIVIGLISIGYMAVKLGDLTLFADSTYTIRARFASVAGLRVGSAVQMLGIEVGKVEALTLDQEKQVAMATLRIQKAVTIYDDAMAAIKTAGLIGDKYVQIDPGGAGTPMEENALIVDTSAPLDIESLIGKFAFGSIGGDDE